MDWCLSLGRRRARRVLVNSAAHELCLQRGCAAPSLRGPNLRGPAPCCPVTICVHSFRRGSVFNCRHSRVPPLRGPSLLGYRAGLGVSFVGFHLAACPAPRVRVASGHYFHLDLFVVRRIHEGKPIKHADVGSMIDGFVAHIASFRALRSLCYSST